MPPNERQAARGQTAVAAALHGEPNIIDSALAAGRDLADIQIITPNFPDAVPFVVLRDADGHERMEYLRERRDAPVRTTGTYVLNDVASFLEYWDRFADADRSIVYASIDPAQFVAVIDHHTDAEAAYEQHRVLYKLGFSQEWNTWTGASSQPFKGNEEFAEWLENQVPDVVEPAGASLLQIALNMKVNAHASFGNQVNLANGKAEFTYTNAMDGSSTVNSGSVAIPELFTIEIPVFAGIEAQKYRIDARFRYRLNSGVLKLWYELVRPHKVLEEAFKDVLGEVTGHIKKAVLFGTTAGTQ